MLYNQLICVPTDEDFSEFELLSNHLSSEILANSDLATKTVNAEFVSYQQNMYRDQSEELESFKESNVNSTILAIFKSIVVTAEERYFLENLNFFENFFEIF